MIYIQTLDRYWNPGSRLLKNLDEATKKNFHYYLANEYVRLVKLGIDKQRYLAKWIPLNPKYLEFKRRNNLSTNIWEATGQLKNSLKVYRSKNTIIIGFDKRLVHKGSNIKLYQLAKWMEYGNTRIPPRPLFRLVYRYLTSNVEYFWEKYQKEEDYR